MTAAGRVRVVVVEPPGSRYLLVAVDGTGRVAAAALPTVRCARRTVGWT
jgi:hypothetical protein